MLRDSFAGDCQIDTLLFENRHADLPAASDRLALSIVGDRRHDYIHINAALISQFGPREGTVVQLCNLLHDPVLFRNRRADIVESLAWIFIWTPNHK